MPLLMIYTKTQEQNDRDFGAVQDQGSAAEKRYFKTSNSLDLFVLSEIMVNKGAKELKEAKLEGILKEKTKYYNQTLSDLGELQSPRQWKNGL